MRAIGLGLVCLLCAACGSDGAGEAGDSGPPLGEPGTYILMEGSAPDAFFDAPFPSDTRLGSDGHPLLTGFPNPYDKIVLERMIEMVGRDAQGFGTTSGVFFRASGPLGDVKLAYADSVKDDAPVFLISIDSGAPDYLRRYPVSVEFREDGGPFGASNLLSLVPLQGVPLRPKQRYAAVVLRSIGDVNSERLGTSDNLAAIGAGLPDSVASAAAWESLQVARAALDEAGIAFEDVAGITAFTTDDPTAGLASVKRAMLSESGAFVPIAPFEAKEVFDDFCVFETRIRVPVYQAGSPPFQEAGGAWAFDASGAALKQHDEEARVSITIPRAPMPAAGYPLVIFSRTGGGGDRPLVDRGVRDASGAVLVPGTGPALEFARAGWAGISPDGPHGGIRNSTGGDEQFLMFNVANPSALRDNVRQSAAELAVLAHLLGDASWSFDASSCPGAAAQASFDTGQLALMGHSMGATISPLSAWGESFRGLILSGEGGSWIANVLYKLKPLPVKGPAEILLGVFNEWSLSEHDPALNLFQWAAEYADPPVYAARIAEQEQNPVHVLMLQGIVDHYIMPPIANTSSLAFGLDLGGDALDASTPELKDFTPIEQLLQFSGRARVSLPVQQNHSGWTGVVTQHAEDGVEDGHEVAFQTDAPKRQYRCFLESLLKGVPVVVGPGAADAPCD